MTTNPPDGQETQPGEPVQADVTATVEAVLFAADKPLPPARISEIAGAAGVRQVRKAVETLNARYEQMGCAFRIVEIAGGYQMQTLPEYSEVLARLLKNRSESRMSSAALETLAIVAYRQPALRADVEAIRGVACGEVLRGLMEKNLLRIVGRADEIGRPLLYGTTRHFLEVFGLASLDDLPNFEQLRRAAEARPPADAPAAETPPPEPQAPPSEAPQQPPGEAAPAPTSDAPAPEPPPPAAPETH